jgi:hypothetical protein
MRRMRDVLSFCDQSRAVSAKSAPFQPVRTSGLVDALTLYHTELLTFGFDSFQIVQIS